MSDIVDRLNDSLSAGYSELRKEAAAEITRLRARIAEMEKQEPVGEVVHNGESAGLYDILEQGALVYSLPGAQPAQSREDEAVRKAWARFSNELHRSHDAPYPGMSEAFEQHFSQSFADREWRAESATWAAAWKAAKRHEAQGQPASSEGSITVWILSGMFLSLDGHDKAQPGYEWRKGWNDAIRQAMDYAQPAPSMPDLLESLRCACNYIDKLGGVSQQYRAMLAAAPEAKP